MMLSAEERRRLVTAAALPYDDAGAVARALFVSHDACEKALREAEAKFSNHIRLHDAAMIGKAAAEHRLSAVCSERDELKARIQKLEAAITAASMYLGTVECEINTCDGCRYETKEAIAILRQALAQPAAPEALPNSPGSLEDDLSEMGLTLYCGACRTRMTPHAFSEEGRCPICGNGTVQELPPAAPEAEKAEVPNE